jgi:hypothetical protein
LSYTIPASIFNLSSIRALRISYNQLEATLPSDVSITLPNLQTIGLSANQFTGSIPFTMQQIWNTFEATPTNLLDQPPIILEVEELVIRTFCCLCSTLFT